MASLNLSSNGPSITQSYNKVVNGPAPSGAAANSPTYGQWALYSVVAPLTSVFQGDAGKESVLKVETTGAGELVDLIDEFSDGRIQFAFVRVKDPNTALPKCVLIAWCGEGVPERTKGYFGSHLGAVSKLLHGYHVQVTARSDRDLTPEGIIQKVADSSGSKYSGGGAPAKSAAAPPPVASKPFMPTRVGGGGGGFAPLGGRSRAAPSNTGAVDNDGWGQDAPPVTRSQLEKVAPAYKPTKVNINELTSQKQEPSRFSAPQRDDTPSDVVRGGYQPIGKVDIAALRRQAKDSGSTQDDRPTIVKGAYEPIGKVDIAAIRARAQGPGGASSSPSGGLSPAVTGGNDEQEAPPKSLSERSAAFNQSERLTSLPKPKVANKFGGSSSFTGTKAPTPGGFSSKPVAAAAPVGTASKTFADEGGKTPAQLWAEKKARERGESGISPQPSGGYGQPASPSQPSRPQPPGAWQSSYTGKKWNEVQMHQTGRSATSNISQQRTGEPEQEEEPASPPAGGVSAARAAFSGAQPMGMGRPSRDEHSAPSPPPLDNTSKPNAGVRGVPMPGLPSRPKAAESMPSEAYIPADQHVDLPTPPAQPRSPSPPTPDVRDSSPIRIAQPVARGRETELEAPEERFSPPPVPNDSLAQAASSMASRLQDEPQIEEEDPARGAAQHAAAATFGHDAAHTAHPAAATGGKRAIVQYDYEKAEDNEVELREGEHVTNIDMVDEDWWMGTNARGESGLFPSNYVELVEDEQETRAPPPPAPVAAQAPSAASHSAPPATAPAGASTGPTATAEYDYEAAEDNELSFPDGATITDVEFPDDDWWFGHYKGKSGLFPANYVKLDE